MSLRAGRILAQTLAELFEIVKPPLVSSFSITHVTQESQHDFVSVILEDQRVCRLIVDLRVTPRIWSKRVSMHYSCIIGCIV